MESQTIQLAVLVVAAMAVLLQAIVLVAIFFTLRSAARSLHEQVEDLRSTLKPLLDRTKELVTRVAPKLEAATDDLAATAHDLRSKTVDVQASAAEIVDRVRHQAERLDAMASRILNGVDQAASFVADAIGKPMRQFAALLASARAVIDTLRGAPGPRSVGSSASRSPSASAPHPSNEKDMVV